MIPANIQEEINRYLGSSPKPYLVPSLDGSSESGCIFWDLPSLKDDDKTIHQRYNELISQIIQLAKTDKHDPKIELLTKEIKELLIGIPVTMKFGFSFVSINDILRLDETKGIRKEWWELHSRFSNQGICIFQGYKDGVVSQIADILISMPYRDQYEFLRINHTRGNNHPVETGQIIQALRKLEAEFGLLIVSASMDFVEFIFDRPIDTKSLSRIRQRLYRLCPSAEELTSSLRLGRVALWWD